MGHPRYTSSESARIGEEIYERDIKPHIDVQANLGRLLSIDIETGDYEIGDDDSIDAPLRLHEKHPGAAVYTLRIGYDAVGTIGGMIERVG